MVDSQAGSIWIVSATRPDKILLALTSQGALVSTGTQQTPTCILAGITATYLICLLCFLCCRMGRTARLHRSGTSFRPLLILRPPACPPSPQKWPQASAPRMLSGLPAPSLQRPWLARAGAMLSRGVRSTSRASCTSCSSWGRRHLRQTRLAIGRTRRLQRQASGGCSS